MTPRDFQIETERRIQLIDPTTIKENKLSSDTIYSLLNEAVDKFWKTRYSGLNVKQTGFEQDQKRTDDLRTLVKTATFKDTQITKDGSIYKIELPKDYNILLSDTAGIAPLDGTSPKCWQKDEKGNYIVKHSDTIEAKLETIDSQLANSLSEHILQYSTAKPLRLVKENNIFLYTDGKYKVNDYTIQYLKKPTIIKFDEFSINENYIDLPEHTHIEIVKLAVQLYLSTKATNNYSQYSNEVATME